MIKRLFSLQKGLRVFLLVLAAISILSLTIYTVADSSRNKKIRDDRNQMRKEFEAILEGLEFDGLDNSTLELIQEYREHVGENSNLIITDDAGYVLYHVNNGFMPGTEQFIVLTDPDAGYRQAYILDPELSVRYMISLNRTYNGMRLMEYSNTYVNNTDLYDSIRQRETLFRGSSDTTDKNMYYAYIGSRGWNIYSIQKNINNSDYKYSLLQRVANTIGITSFILFWLTLPIWTFLDAKKRNYKPALWGILTLITNIIGLIIYILTRSENPTCQICGELLDTKYIYCPYCGAENKEVCHSCRTVLEKNWIVCPKCGQKVTNERKTIMLADEPENNPE